MVLALMSQGVEAEEMMYLQWIMAALGVIVVYILLAYSCVRWTERERKPQTAWRRWLWIAAEKIAKYVKRRERERHAGVAEKIAKFIERLGWGVAFGLAVFAVQYGVEWFQNNKPGLTGTTRSDFVYNTKIACYGFISNSYNKGVPHPVRYKYCDCYADRMADKISVNKLNSLSAKLPMKLVVETLPRNEVVAQSCLETVSSGQAQSN